MLTSYTSKDVAESAFRSSHPSSTVAWGATTGEVISAKQLIAWEKGKDKIWEAADNLYSLLANMAEEREYASQRLLIEAAVIRDHLNTYDRAEDMLDTQDATRSS